MNKQIKDLKEAIINELIKYCAANNLTGGEVVSMDSYYKISIYFKSSIYLGDFPTYLEYINICEDIKGLMSINFKVDYMDAHDFLDFLKEA